MVVVVGVMVVMGVIDGRGESVCMWIALWSV